MKGVRRTRQGAKLRGRLPDSPGRRRRPRLADRALLAQRDAPPGLAGLLVIPALPQLLLEAGPFQELLEAAQSRADGFAVVDSHSQGHDFSVKILRAAKPTGEFTPRGAPRRAPARASAPSRFA